jgi:hypothetical protein
LKLEWLIDKFKFSFSLQNKSYLSLLPSVWDIVPNICFVVVDVVVILICGKFGSEKFNNIK